VPKKTDRTKGGLMVGITSYGAYVPFARLAREAIGPGLRGEKALANFDEDSITLAVAAATDCLTGIERKDVDGLLFASTTSPYTEKQASTMIAAALDLRSDATLADFANSMRGATVAMKAAMDAVKAGSAKKVLVTAADCRMGNPGSSTEQNSGDGAGAVVIGDTDVAVSIEAVHSASDEIMDTWRDEGDTFVSIWQERFVNDKGLISMTKQAVKELLAKTKLSPNDFSKVVFYTPDARRATELAKGLGFDPKTQLQNPLIDVMGCTGTAQPLMLLVAALEEAKAGDLILLASYGSGSDAMVLKVTDQIEKIRNRRGMKKHLESKRIVNDYKTYLNMKGIIGIEGGRRPATLPPSAAAVWRERNEIIRLYAGKCKACGKVQYPPQRVCISCRSKDNFEHVRLSDKKGELFTFAMDYISSAQDIPMVVSVVNMEGGGRILNIMTDRVLDDLKVGMSVEMTFRKLYTVASMHHYFWKSTPCKGLD